MPVFFSSVFFGDRRASGRDHEWVMMNEELLAAIGCKDVCDFALFSFCVDGDKKNFYWRADAGSNWGVQDERVTVVSFILQHRVLKKAFETTLVFTAEAKTPPVMLHMFLEPTGWGGSRGRYSRRIATLSEEASVTSVNCFA